MINFLNGLGLLAHCGGPFSRFIQRDKGTEFRGMEPQIRSLLQLGGPFGKSIGAGERSAQDYNPGA